MKSFETQILSNFPPPNPAVIIPCTKTPTSNSVANSAINGNPGGAAIETATFYQLSTSVARLLVWDVTNPAAMNLVGNQTLNSGAFAVNQASPAAIGVLNKIAYVANYDGAGNDYLAAYDCTNPAAITQAGHFLLGANTSNQAPRRVAISVVGGDTFCFVAFNDNINIIKVTNPAAMTSVATVTVPDVATNGADGVFILSNVLYATTVGLASSDFRAKAWNVAIPSAPVLKWDTAITLANAFTLPDIYAVNQSGVPIAVVLVQTLAGHGGLQTLDGASGAILGSLSFTTGDVEVDAQEWIDPIGSCLEVMMNNAAILRLCDIGDPTNPVRKSDLSVGGQFSTVTGLSSGTPTSIFVAGIVGGGNFNLRVNSVNV